MRDFIIGTTAVISRPKQANMAKETLRLDNSAIKPIIGGHIRKPKNPIVETVAIAIPAGILRERPAKLKQIGTTDDTPAPTSINPSDDHKTDGNTTDIIIPTNTSTPLACNIFAIPNLIIRRSATNLPNAIVPIKAI